LYHLAISRLDICKKGKTGYFILQQHVIESKCAMDGMGWHVFPNQNATKKTPGKTMEQTNEGQEGKNPHQKQNKK
jgi:hypothetical protein